MNTSAISAAIRRWVIDGTRLAADRVIYAQQDSPRPKTPFATIDPTNVLVRQGIYDEEVLSETVNGQIDRITRYRITSSLQVWGPGAVGLCADAQAALDRYDVSERLYALGLAVADRGTVRDVTSVLSSRHEERGVLDVQFAWTVQRSETPGWIETVTDMTGTLTEWGDPPVPYIEIVTIP